MHQVSSKKHVFGFGLKIEFLSLFGEKSLLFYFPGEKVPPLWPKRGKNFDPTLTYLKIPVDRALLET